MLCRLNPSEVKWKSLSRVWLFATPWTTACQAPLSMEFSRQEYKPKWCPSKWGELSLTRMLCSVMASSIAQPLRIYLQCRKHRRRGFDPWVRKIPWRRKWQPTPEFLSGKSREQRSLAGYSPCGHKESDTTERLTRHNFRKTEHPQGDGEKLKWGTWEGEGPEGTLVPEGKFLRLAIFPEGKA